jgi:peptide/nickel transport system ATP-binding protein
MSDPLLTVSNLSVQFPGQEQRIQAVDGVSFELQPGETLAIVGESGSGKSVTALALMGLVPSPGQVRGEILFQGQDLLRLAPKQWPTYRGRQIAMIFQEPQSSLNPVYTCGFQISEALRQHHKLSAAEANRQAAALLQEVQLLPPDAVLQSDIQAEFRQRSQNERWLQQQINHRKQSMLDRYPHQLSGGQIQRVMIAIAIAGRPTLLIADESTTALDVTVQATILNLLRDLKQQHQMSMLFITHDLGLVAAIADRVAVMYHGNIVEVGTIQQVFTAPQHPYTQALLACRPQPDYNRQFLPTIPDFMANGSSQSASESGVHVSVIDRQGDQLTPATIAQRLERLQSQPALLSVRDLRVTFPVKGLFGQAKRYVMAVNGLAFEIYPGETLGLVGESGCGKSTLARALMRLIQPSQGQIWFEGRDILALSGRSLRQFRRDLQLIFQDPLGSLNPRMSIGEAITEPMRLHSAKPNPKRDRDRAAYLLERVGLNPDWMHRYPHEFSGGQRQRICIARALALSPKCLICDESVSALDVSVQAQVLNLLKELQAEFDLTYLFISHDLSVVKFMSDRILVMNQGKSEEIGPADLIYHHPTQPYTQTLIAAVSTLALQ